MDEALERIQRYVRSGFYTPDEIAGIVREDEFEGQLTSAQLRVMIAQVVAQYLASEETWPAVTDCDRLDEVFDSLERQGIIALQNAGYTMSDGWSDVAEFYRDAGGAESGFDGYCYYHGQDLEGAMEYGGLHIAFGDIDGDDVKGVEVGRRIRRAFESASFSVDWNESIRSRLYISPIKWQRRQPRNT